MNRGVPPRAPWPWSLALILLLAFGLRAFRLDELSLWVDEGFSAYHTRAELWRIPGLIAALDRHPPLHYLALWLWSHLSGDSPYALRFFSLMAGTLTVAVVAQLGKGLFGRPVGALGAAVLALSPFHVWYSQEARMYALVALLGSLSLLLLLRLISLSPSRDIPTRTQRRLLWAGYVFTTALSLLTHYYGFFLVPLGLLLLGLSGRLTSLFRRWFWAQVLVGILYLPWIPGMLEQYGRAPGGFRVPVGMGQILGNLTVAFSLGERFTPPTLDWMAVAFLLLLVVGLLRFPGDVGGASRRGVGAALLWLLLPVLLAYLLSLFLGLDLRAYGRMYYIVSLPAFVLLLGRGLWNFWRFHRGALALAVVALLPPILWASYAQYFESPKEDFRAAATYIADHAWQDDAIILHAEHIYPAFSYYYAGPLPWYRAVVADPQTTQRWLQETTAGKGRVWLVLSHAEVSDPQGTVIRWFEERALRTDERWLPGIQLLSYAMEPRPNYQLPAVGQRREIAYQDQIQLLGYDLAPLDPRRSTLHLALYWRVLAPVPEDYRVVLLLLGRDGLLWSQVDRVPLAEAYPTSRWAAQEVLTDRYVLPVPPGLPPDDYEIRVQLYSPATKQALRARDESGVLPGGRGLLGRVRWAGGASPSYQEARRSVEVVHDRPLGASFRLVGSTLSPRASTPGGELQITLLWQAVGTLAPGERTFLEVADSQQRVLAREPLFTEATPYPPPLWQRDEIVRTQHRLRLPGSLDTGQYRLRVGLENPLNAPLRDSTLLGVVDVTAPQRVFTVPNMGTHVRANFADQITLLGYDVASPRPRPGETLHLTLYWQDRAPLKESYAVFVHLLDGAERLVAQHDGIPGSGLRPTPSWASQEVIVDEHPVPLPADLAPGPYRLAVGLYLPDKGQRLLALPSRGQPLSDKVVLPGEIRVEPAPR